MGKALLKCDRDVEARLMDVTLLKLNFFVLVTVWCLVTIGVVQIPTTI